MIEINSIEDICNLIDLSGISLSNSKLIGEIPSCIGNLTNLTCKQVADRLNEIGYTSSRGRINIPSTVCSTYFKIRKHFEIRNIYHPPDIDDVELVWE